MRNRNDGSTSSRRRHQNLAPVQPSKIRIDFVKDTTNCSLSVQSLYNWDNQVSKSFLSCTIKRSIVNQIGNYKQFFINYSALFYIMLITMRKTLVNLWKLKRIQGISNEFVNSLSATFRCCNVLFI